MPQPENPALELKLRALTAVRAVKTLNHKPAGRITHFAMGLEYTKPPGLTDHIDAWREPAELITEGETI